MGLMAASRPLSDAPPSSSVRIVLDAQRGSDGALRWSYELRGGSGDELIGRMASDAIDPGAEVPAVETLVEMLGDAVRHHVGRL